MSAIAATHYFIYPNMKTIVLLAALSAACGIANAQTEKVIDICVKNTSSSYQSYSTSTSVPSGTTLKVYTSRYSDFYPTLLGKGNLEMYCGGERSYIGNHSDMSYPNWNSFTGNVDIYPHKAVEANAGFYGVIMPNNKKSYSPEDANTSGRINTVFYNNKVLLHEGAAIAAEKSAVGIRIGELNTEAGSRLYGYYKSQSAATSAYYLIGSLNTDATLAGRIASTEKNGTPDGTQAVGIIKEGKGTYILTANDNQISGAIRVNAGTLLINNDAVTAKAKKLTGGTGAAATASMPVAYVFNGGTIGGNGNIGGSVDLYGTLMPGAGNAGTLYIANYATSARCNLTVHPASVIKCNITDATAFTSLDISGQIIHSSLTEKFEESSTPTQIAITLSEDNNVKVGDTFTLVRAAKGREDAGTWAFRITLPEKLSWTVNEKTGDDGSYTLSITCTSLEDGNTGGNEGDDNGDTGDKDDDEQLIDISGTDIAKNLYLRKYVEMLGNDKRIGVCIPSWWKINIPANPSYTEAQAISNNFNLCVAENEMKPNVIQPSQGSFDFNYANEVVNYAKSKKMATRGHTLVWHSQIPEWISSDGKKNDKNWTRTQLLEIMKNHITRTVKQFGTNVIEWDVVNETLDDDQSIVRTNPNGYQLRKESVWVKVIGEDFIDSAFVYAHRANPNAKLYLNDYDCEYSGSAKTLALFNLAKRLQKDGIPIDGVGLQCHLKVDSFDKQALNSTVKKYATIGLNCIFTEIDMAIYSTDAATLNRQAEAYKQITEVFLRNDNCPHMVLWGINDKHSWVADSHPLLFNEYNQAKPAYYSVQSALHYQAAANAIISGIENVKKDAEAAHAEAAETIRYNAAGQIVNAPCRGLNIVRMSDGSVRKEMR